MKLFQLTNQNWKILNELRKKSELGVNFFLGLKLFVSSSRHSFMHLHWKDTQTLKTSYLHNFEDKIF